MAFIPHSSENIEAMLQALEVSSIEDLFDEIAPSLRTEGLDKAKVPASINEAQANRWLTQLSQQDRQPLSFLGAGAYEHHIPAVVWDLVSRGEFMTAYTPYQAEASQGTLQVIYEYQTMMASLMGHEVSNASMYDGATALAEAILMTVRLQKKKQKVLVPETLPPHYGDAITTLLVQQDIELVTLPLDEEGGITCLDRLPKEALDEVAALVIPQPNFLGCLEFVDELTDWAHGHGMLVIGCVNPLAMSLLKEPGQWGEKGADISCGSGQPFGVPLASGGPYFGFLCCKKAYIRQLPGRIVGKTVDKTGREGYTLTLQAREQHIRRSKARSNICTNQGLLMTAATIYMSLMGPHGLYQIAGRCHTQTKKLAERLAILPGVKIKFTTPYFHEVVIELPTAVESVLSQLLQHGVQGGYALNQYDPQWGEALLICATETKSDEDIDYFYAQLKAALGA
jgi:glycine dehydrogenase subunit 1